MSVIVVMNAKRISHEMLFKNKTFYDINIDYIGCKELLDKE